MNSLNPKTPASVELAPMTPANLFVIRKLGISPTSTKTAQATRWANTVHLPRRLQTTTSEEHLDLLLKRVAALRWMARRHWDE